MSLYSSCVCKSKDKEGKEEEGNHLFPKNEWIWTSSNHLINRRIGLCIQAFSVRRKNKYGGDSCA
jgi:hypothetical protein